jgi:hypothetical protein
VPDLFGVGGEPDDPAVSEENQGVIVRQSRSDSPGNIGLPEAWLMRRKPLRHDQHIRILSALALICKCTIVKCVTRMSIFSTAKLIQKLADEVLHYLIVMSLHLS